jgi:hypothetical protein
MVVGINPEVTAQQVWSEIIKEAELREDYVHMILLAWVMQVIPLHTAGVESTFSQRGQVKNQLSNRLSIDRTMDFCFLFGLLAATLD